MKIKNVTFKDDEFIVVFDASQMTEYEKASFAERILKNKDTDYIGIFSKEFYEDNTTFFSKIMKGVN